MSNAEPSLSVVIDTHFAAAKQTQEQFVETLNDVQATLRMLKISMGMSPGQLAIKNIGKGAARPTIQPARGSAKEADLQTRRKAAAKLMEKGGFRMHQNCYDIKNRGMVRIVGPNGFDAEFFDVADFDGTDTNSIDND